MTRDEIDAAFTHVDPTNPQHIDTWHAPENRKASEAFTKLMSHRRYGFDPLLDAWVWFLDGWNRYDG